MPELVLHCFRSSHFNEKAHWGLNRKRLDYTVIEHWPGPHMPVMKALSGQPSTPVLVIDGRVVAGSTEILRVLDEIAPDDPLFPEDPEEQARCLEMVRWLDDEVGPAVRLALFQELLPDLDGVARTFVRAPWGWRERLYRQALPMIRVVMKRSMKINASNAVAARQTIRSALDRIAREGGPDGGYLVGDRFTVADLTAAALLSILSYPDGFHAPLPQPLPPAVPPWLDEWAGHDGTRWVEAMYARHRRI
jgi:glutathione S-transferase